MSALPVADATEPGDRALGAGLLPLRLPVLGATASARTGLAAFHRSLVRVGLGDYNLVRLSSVIPPATDVGAGRPDHRTLPPVWPGRRPHDFVDGVRGDRVYCVYAERRTEVPGEAVWAGVAWVRRTDGQGGYFVEHDGTSAEAVEHALRTSLADMVADAPAAYGAPELVLEGVVCEDRPVCALVVVPYAAIGW